MTWRRRKGRRRETARQRAAAKRNLLKARGRHHPGTAKEKAAARANLVKARAKHHPMSAKQKAAARANLAKGRGHTAGSTAARRVLAGRRHRGRIGRLHRGSLYAYRVHDPLAATSVNGRRNTKPHTTHRHTSSGSRRRRR